METSPAVAEGTFGAEMKDNKQGCFTPDSGVGEPFTLPPNVRFSMEYGGVFAQWG